MENQEGLPLVLCGAKSKRTGRMCRQPAMKNGRCRLHGGKSTGPRTVAGRQKIREVNTSSGVYTMSFITSRENFKRMMELVKEKKGLFKANNY